jgi:hypothetical protein
MTAEIFSLLSGNFASFGHRHAKTEYFQFDGDKRNTGIILPDDYYRYI